jgi:hypothetical protein
MEKLMKMKIKFMNKKDALLTPESEAELFRGIEWEEVDYGHTAGKFWRRSTTGQVDEQDAIAFGNTVFYGHVLVTQEKFENPQGEIVGKSTNIVPMDDAKLKVMEWRSGYYGSGTFNLGHNPTQ